jgi:hypothetical protein
MPALIEAEFAPAAQGRRGTAASRGRKNRIQRPHIDAVQRVVAVHEHRQHVAGHGNCRGRITVAGSKTRPLRIRHGPAHGADIRRALEQCRGRRAGSDGAHLYREFRVLAHQRLRPQGHEGAQRVRTRAHQLAAQCRLRWHGEEQGQAERRQEQAHHWLNTRENVLPRPGWLSICSSARFDAATCLTMASPSPVPPVAELRLSSTR